MIFDEGESTKQDFFRELLAGEKRQRMFWKMAPEKELSIGRQLRLTHR